MSIKDVVDALSLQSTIRWTKKFESERSKYYDFTNEVDKLLQKIIAAQEIDLVNVEARTKSVDSFQEKVSRSDKDYKDPNSEITDLSGCRIICYYKEDIEKIEKLLRENFQIDEENSERKVKISNPKEFGYLSTHIIVSLNADRAVLPEYSRFAGMKAEIQLRTALQHAWAAIEHKLQYKQAADVPQPLQRRFFRISALLELADDEFSYLKEKLETLRAEYESEFQSGDLSSPINAESVEVFIDNSEYLRSLQAKLDSVGFNIPPVNENTRRPLGKLLETLRIAEIGEISSLLDFIIQGKAEPEEWVGVFRRIFEAWYEPGRPPKLVMDTSTLVRTMIVLNSKRTRANQILNEVPFGEKLGEAIRGVLDKKA